MKPLLILAIFIFSNFYVNAQAPAIEWQKCLGGSSSEYAQSIIQTQDEGYIAAGWSSSTNADVTGSHGEEDAWIVKLDSLGIIEWQKALGGSDDDRANSIQQTQDGGYVFTGKSDSNDGNVSGNNGSDDVWVVKLDALGNLIWQKSLGGSNYDKANSISQTQDGGYIVAGYSSSNNWDVSGNHGTSDFWIVKLDALGSISWQKALGGSGLDAADFAQQTQDGGYIVSGYTESNDADVSGNHGGNDTWVVKLDSFGNITWQKCLGGSASDGARSIYQTQDGGYVLAGYSSSNDGDVIGNHGDYDAWVIRLDSLGNITWQKCLGGSASDGAEFITQTQDGGYIVAGNNWSNDGDVSGNHGLSDLWILKLNALGDITWQKSIGGSNYDLSSSIVLTQDGGYIVAGASISNDGDVSGNLGNYDYWIVKLSPDSSVTTSEKQIILGITSLTLYPNPASEMLTLELEGKTQENYQIFDLQGKVVLQGVLNQGKNLVNIANLAKGSYVIRTETTGMPFEVVE